jgi:hypothetical protein
VAFLKRNRWVILGIGTVVIVVAFLAFRPDKLFVDDVVDESLSDAFGVASAADTATAPTTTAPTATTVPPSDDAPSETSTTTGSTTTSTTQPAQAEPEAVSAGAFFGIDHSAEGTARIYEFEGDHVLRFEDDTDIQNGPDLYVWVLADDDYEGGEPVGYIDLGKIKGNVGGQNYELPDEFDPAVYRFVLIWCQRFSVPFAAAPLT